jgi:dTDP-4-amino-4,6-dideoxygalactose transaminase
MSHPRFLGSFTQQEPIPEAAITAAVAVLRSGRLHRYNLAPGEVAETALLERDYADWQGSRFCLAVTSAGQAIQIALRAAGVASDDPVLTNGFTLAPVPGAIQAVGGRPVLVEIDQNLRIDMADLAAKASATGAKTLLLSHMRGHLCDMDRLMAVADQAGLTVIEDCAHTMGARWNGTRSGNFGRAACFSTQTYKHINSGEGGLLTSDDPDLIARATSLSGSYMFHDRHGAGPEADHFDSPRYQMPNTSARMDNLRAAILRPQLPLLAERIDRWNRRYLTVARELVRAKRIVLPQRASGERMVGSSIQFRIPGLGAPGCEALIAKAAGQGVELKWLGAPEPHGFSSTHRSWRYLPVQALPATDAIMAELFDMRLPLTFSLEDCTRIGSIIADAATEVCQ